jgi:hypothetical protein
MGLVRAAFVLLVLLTVTPPLIVATYLTLSAGRGSPLDLLAPGWPMYLGWPAIATVPSVAIIALLSLRKNFRPLLGGVPIIVAVCALLSAGAYLAMGGASNQFSALAVLAFFAGISTILPVYLLCYLLRRPLGLRAILGE